jgi:hypothetical protein
VGERAKKGRSKTDADVWKPQNKTKQNAPRYNKQQGLAFLVSALRCVAFFS